MDAELCSHSDTNSISKLFSEFKSGVCAGQSSFSTIDSVKHCNTDLALCTGTLNS